MKSNNSKTMGVLNIPTNARGIIPEVSPNLEQSVAPTPAMTKLAPVVIPKKLESQIPKEEIVHNR